MKCHQHDHIAGNREEITQPDALQRSFKQRTVFDVTSLTTSVFGILAAFMKQSGRSPRARVNDLWIGAQAMENDYALLTANLKDFDGLLVYEYLVREYRDCRHARSPKSEGPGAPSTG